MIDPKYLLSAKHHPIRHRTERTDMDENRYDAFRRARGVWIVKVDGSTYFETGCWADSPLAVNPSLGSATFVGWFWDTYWENNESGNISDKVTADEFAALIASDDFVLYESEEARELERS